MANVDIVALGLLLFVACLVAIVSRRIGLPYAVGLVLAGIGLNLLGYQSGLALTPELIFAVLLPPTHIRGGNPSRLEAILPRSSSRAEHGIHWYIAVRICRCSRNALGGRMGWQASLLFGALIAATDPVSVIAMMKEQQADQRLRFLMESESLVNDGAAAVLFTLVVAWMSGGDTGPGAIALSLASTVAAASCADCSWPVS